MSLSRAAAACSACLCLTVSSLVVAAASHAATGREAAPGIAASVPEAVAPQKAELEGGYPVRVRLVASGRGYLVYNSQVGATVGRRGPLSFSIDTPSGVVTFKGQGGVRPYAVRDRAVIVGGSTGPDTVLRPTLHGVQTFVRSTSAGVESQSWHVGGAAHRLRASHDGSVRILDRAGKLAATLSAPKVTGASGTGGAARLTIDGRRLELTLDGNGRSRVTAQVEAHSDIGMLVVTDYDVRGRYRGRTVDPTMARYLLSSQSVGGGGRSARAGSVGTASRAQAIAHAADSSGDVSTTGPSGCRTVDKAHTQRTAFGTVAFRFHGVIRWCWHTNHTITNVDVNPGWRITDTNGQEYWRGVVFRDDDRYTFGWGVSSSGYKHSIQGHFENCVLRYGCLRSDYPKVNLYAHGNGTLHYSEQG